MQFERVRLVIHKLMVEPITAVTPVLGGESNQVFTITTSQNDYILRLSTEENGLKNYQKEAWCIQQAAQQGVPGPDILEIGENANHAFMLQRRIPGVVGTEFSGDKTAVWHTLGQYARRIHQIPVSGYGYDLHDPATNSFRHTWFEFLDYAAQFPFWDGTLVEAGVLTAGQQKRAQTMLTQLYDWEFTPALCHANLELKNVIISPNETVYLIDWGSAQAHRAPHLDVAELYAWEVDSAYRAAFCEGYGLSPTRLRQMQPELELLVLLRAVDSAKWVIDLKHPNQKYFVTHAAKIVRNII